MSIFKVLYACEPTHLLQAILRKEEMVCQAKEKYYRIQKIIYQGALLSAATIVGVGACASEELSLIADIFCKSGQLTIRAAQYVTNWEYLEKPHKTLNRPSLAYRMERIIGQALGVRVSLFGTLFLLAIRDNWVVQQHYSLGNYFRAPAPRSGRPLPPTPQKVPAPPPQVSTPQPPPAPKVSLQELPSPSEEPSTSIPLPPPLPPLPSESKISTKTQATVDRGNFLEEIQKKGGQKRKVFTIKKRPAKVQGTIARALSARFGNLEKGERPKSKDIEYMPDGGFAFQAHVPLGVVIDEMGLNLNVEDDRLDDTLDSYIFDLNGGKAKKDQIFEIRDESQPNQDFMIQVVELYPNGQVKKVFINYLESKVS